AIGDPEAPDGEEPADGRQYGAARDHEVGPLPPDAGDGRPLLPAHAGEALADPVDGGEVQARPVDARAVVARQLEMHTAKGGDGAGGAEHLELAGAGGGA